MKPSANKQGETRSEAGQSSGVPPAEQLPRTEAGWKQRLTPEQFQVTRCSATEAPFTGRYWNCEKEGVYRCVCCGAPLFNSGEKYQSGTGWPSFWRPAAEEAVAKKADRSLGTVRTEAVCARCGAHLGHVFPDGPQPTGLRYCINSAALSLEESRPETDLPPSAPPRER